MKTSLRMIVCSKACFSSDFLCVGVCVCVCVYVWFWFSRFSVRRWEFSVRSLILAAVCITIAVVWVVYRNEDRCCHTSSSCLSHTHR